MDMQTSQETNSSSQSSALLRRGRRPVRWALMLGLPLLLGVLAFSWWQYNRQWATTDNAYVQQDKVSVSAEVNGPIVAVLVKDGQYVTAGTPLFRIDTASYEIALRQAEAELAEAQVDVHALTSDYAASSVDIGAAREDIAFAQATFNRQRALWERGFTTKADYDAAEHAVSQARERLRAAQAAANQARAKLSTGAAVPGENPAVASARVKRDKALLDLSRSTVKAPVSGRIAQADRLQVGQMMVTGLPAVNIVISDRSWVEANFKETELARMKAGQKATIEFDAYPELQLKGHVSSIGAGTGSEFSILPAQNATGNWVKVTQRVPVRIAIDEKPSRVMIAGLSAIVHVDLMDDN